MTGNWSDNLENHYDLRLPDDVRDWFDRRCWAESGGAEFCYPQSPEQLLNPDPGSIWAGFMLPDTLPMIGNDYGDWLCLRIGSDGSVVEIIHWSHCGGDWLPIGRSLAEALVYDAACHLMYGQRPEFTEPCAPSDQLFRHAEWARRHLPSRNGLMEPIWKTRSTGPADAGDRREIRRQLTTAGVAEVAVLRDRLLDCLASPLKEQSDTQLARELNVAWEPDFVRCLFDTATIPVDLAQTLVDRFDMPAEQLFHQDWTLAAQLARQVVEMRHDLGWACDVAGWAAERSGDLEQAVAYYLTGTRTSWFSDDTLRFRSHWFDERRGKFAAARLVRLRDQLNSADDGDPYLSLFWELGPPDALQRRVHDFCLRQAEEAMAGADPETAYDWYYRAGWDLGLKQMDDYRTVLDGMARAAASAQWPARAKIARLHSRVLRLLSTARRPGLYNTSTPR